MRRSGRTASTAAAHGMAGRLARLSGQQGEVARPGRLALQLASQGQHARQHAAEQAERRADGRRRRAARQAAERRAGRPRVVSSQPNSRVKLECSRQRSVKKAGATGLGSWEALDHQ